MSCRLFQKLREELALCYTVYSFRTFFSDTGMWTIYANTTPGQTTRFLAALDQELSRLLKEPLTAAEIEDAKSHLVGSMILSREDMETRMKRLVRQHLMMDRILTFDESVSALRAVTRDAAEAHAAALPARGCLQPACLRNPGDVPPQGIRLLLCRRRTEARPPGMSRGRADRLLHREH